MPTCSHSPSIFFTAISHAHRLSNDWPASLISPTASHLDGNPAKVARIRNLDNWLDEIVVFAVVQTFEDRTEPIPNIVVGRHLQFSAIGAEHLGRCQLGHEFSIAKAMRRKKTAMQAVNLHGINWWSRERFENQSGD